MFAAGLDGQWWPLLVVAATLIAGMIITVVRKNKRK
jgi:hypothetical protein